MTQSITAYLDLEEESNPIVEVLDLGSIDSDPMVAILDLNVNSTIVPWGTIYGNIEDQLDLQEALYQLYPKSNPENYTSNKITFKVWYKEDTPESISVTGVTISGETSVDIGSTIDLTATVTPEDATDKEVTWMIMDGNEYATITPNGATCTVTGIAEGSTIIRVTTHDGDFIDEITLNVVDSGIVIPVTGMTITSSTGTLTVGTTAVVLSHITPVYATNKSVAWSLTSGSEYAIMNPSVDTTACTVTATSVGTVVVTGISVDGGFTDSTTINIIEGA